MNRLNARFSGLATRGEKALVTFVTAGDPFPDRTADVLVALADGGADVIEVGIPFSDPLADGPTIQSAGFRALAAGMNPPKVLDAIRDARGRGVDVPILVMGAWNPILQYGIQRFVADAADAGVDGAILTDLTPEESDDWKSAADAGGLSTIYLLAPTSTPDRIALVGARASGFVYCVSMTGITGVQEIVPDDLPVLVNAIREKSHGVPVCVGFGIRRPDQVRAVAQIADGVVVGSEIVKRLHENRESPSVLTDLRDYISELKTATK